MVINVDIRLLFSRSLLALLAQTDTETGLSLPGLPMTPFLCAEVKETSRCDKSQDIPEVFSITPVCLSRNKCAVDFF